MDFNPNQVRAKLQEALQASGYISNDNARQIAEHFTIWMGDLTALCRLYQHPENFENEQVEEILIDFLFHAPDHLAAAKKLLTGSGVSDIFKVGAVEIASNQGDN